MRFTGTVRSRPVRVGFLVPPNDMAMVRRVVRLCSCVWGGRYNPIIPFSDANSNRWLRPHQAGTGLDVARGYVDFFEPDVLVETSAGMAESLGWRDTSRRFELPRIVTLDNFYEVDKREWVQFAAGIDILNVIHHLYDKDYKYQRRHPVPYALVEHTEDHAFFDVFPGTYPDDEALKPLKSAYREVFEPQDLPASAATSFRLLSEHFAGPLWITRYDLKESFGRGPSESTFYVFDPSDAGDVLDYWNFRLVTRDVIPVNVKWIAEHASLLRDSILERHRPIPYNPFGTMFHTNVVFSRSIEDDTLAALTREHLAGLPSRSFIPQRDPSIWTATRDRDNWRTAKIVVTSGSERFDEEVDADGFVRIPAPSPEFRDSAHIHTSARWINVVSPGRSYRENGPAVVFPTNIWDPGYPRLAATGGDYTVTREGWTSPEQSSIGYSLLSLLDGRDAIVGWFKANGIEAHPSEEGQVAAQIIASAGNLMACGMFAHLDTLNLLNGMAESHAERHRGGRRVSATSPDRARHADLIRQHFEKREKLSFGYWNKLEFFLQRSVFRAGLRVRCPTCAHYNWFDLDAISYSPTCSRCLKQFKFAQAPTELQKVQWFYRVIGPFAAPDYARGGYAVALTLRCIAERHESEMTWSTGLALRELNCEVDFAAWYRPASSLDDEEREEPTLLIGEAKSFGRNAIDEHALASLRQLGERFPGAVLVVSSLKPVDDYSTAELQGLRELATWGRTRRFNGGPRNPVVVLTAVELFAEHGIAQAWKDAGGRAAELVGPAYVDLRDLHRLAEATQRLYLNLPAFSADYAAEHALRARRVQLLRVIRARAEASRQVVD